MTETKCKEFKEAIEKYYDTFDYETQEFSHNVMKDLFLKCNLRLCEENKTENSSITLSDFDNMEGLVFENWCASLLSENGYNNVEVTRGSGDQGVDIVCQKDDIKYAIQCKCYTYDLGNTPVQEVHAGKNIYKCQIGVVMTNRYFTAGAKELAESTGVLLWDRDKILYFLRNANNNCLQKSQLKNITSDFCDDISLDLIKKSLRLIITEGAASTSLLQREFNLSYTKSAYLIDKLEKMGVIGPYNNSHSRKLLMDKKHINELINKL